MIECLCLPWSLPSSGTNERLSARLPEIGSVQRALIAYDPTCLRTAFIPPRAKSPKKSEVGGGRLNVFRDLLYLG